MSKNESVDEWTLILKWIAKDTKEDLTDEQIRGRAWDLARQEDELARLRDQYRQIRRVASGAVEVPGGGWYYPPTGLTPQEEQEG